MTNPTTHDPSSMSQTEDVSPDHGEKDSPSHSELSDGEFWGSRHIFSDYKPPPQAPSSASPKKRTPALTPVATQTVECLVVGPEGVGKTSWIGALERGCCTLSEGSHDLHLFAREESHQIGKEAVETIVSDGELRFAPSVGVRSDFFEAGILTRGKPPKIWQVLKLIELPAKAFTASADDLRQSIDGHWSAPRGHRCLVLCVDASTPQLGFWQTCLSRFLENLRNLDSVDRASAYGFLSVDRVLVLMTKIDVPLRHLERQEGHNIANVASLSSMNSVDELAKRIDPVRQSGELLGETTLELLRKKIAPGVPIAAGTISARGFHVDSSSAIETNGESEQRLKSWKPFGLSDVARFLAFGEIRGQLKQAMVAPGKIHSWKGTVQESSFHSTS